MRVAAAACDAGTGAMGCGASCRMVNARACIICTASGDAGGAERATGAESVNAATVGIGSRCGSGSAGGSSLAVAAGTASACVDSMAQPLIVMTMEDNVISNLAVKRFAR